MTTFVPLSPLPFQFQDAITSLNLSGGSIEAYLAGTTTPTNLYADSVGTSLGSIVTLNAGGFPSSGSNTVGLWRDDSIELKLVLKNAIGAVIGTPIDHIPTSASALLALSPEDIGSILYPQTPAEIAAGVTPTQSQYLESTIDRYGVNSTPGTTDMTTAIQSAHAVHVAGGAPVQFLAAQYLVTDTCITITAAQPRVKIYGVPLRTILLNKAGANKATIDIQGAQYWDISGLVLIGATGFQNKGIYLHKDGSSNRCAYFNLKDIVCQTNGVGIHIQDTNSGYIENFQYWPSGGSSFGGTIDSNSRRSALLADGTSAVNSIHVRNVNISGLNTIAADATSGAILLDATTAGAPFQDWTLDSVDAENSGTRALWLRNCINIKTTNLFHENTEVRIDTGSVRNVFIAASAASTGTVVISNTGGACRQQTFIGCNAASVTADSTCSENVYINCNYAVAPGLSDTNQVTVFNTETTGSVLLGDQINMQWTTPAFSAGDYTSSAGSWTVASGDVTTCEYVVQGKFICLNLTLDTTTVAGGPSGLRRVIPGGFTAAKSGYFPIVATQDNGTTTLQAIARLVAGSTTISFQRDLAATAWSNVTDLNGIYASIRFEIQ